MARTKKNIINIMPDKKIPQSWWNKIALLKLPLKTKEKLSKHIIKECHPDQLFWTQILISTLIATYGLLQNSVAVIIGAMLIAPMLRPIQGVAFSLSNGNPKKFVSASKLLIWTIVISITSATLFAWIVPLRIETTEIITRTSPNLLDLFIAIASGIIAILALSYKKLSESIAGVAMSAALLPPLAVVGIEISLWNINAAGGAFFLFITNLFAILFVGIIIFLMYGFNPHREDKQWQTIKNFSILMSLIIFISVPLYSSLINISEKISIETLARQVITSSLTENIPEASLASLTVQSFDNSSADLIGTIKIPKGENFFADTQESIRKKLGQTLRKDVNFSVEIIPIASIISTEQRQQQQTQNKQDNIKQSIKTFLKTKLPKATIISLTLGKIESEQEASWAVKIIFSLPPGQEFSETLENTLNQQINQLFPTDTINSIWIQLSSQKAQQTNSPTPSQIHLDQLSLEWANFIKQQLPQECTIKNIEITWSLPPAEQLNDIKDISKISSYTIKFDLYTPKNNQVAVARFKRSARLFAKNLHKKPTTFNIRTFTFEKETLSTFTKKPSTKTQTQQ